MYWALIVILLFVCLVMTAAILAQAGQGGGLASMGGGMGTEMVMGGRQATTLLHTVTWWCGGVFLFLALVLAIMSSRTSAPRSVLEGQQGPAPVQPAPLPIQSSPAQPSQQTPSTGQNNQPPAPPNR